MLRKKLIQEILDTDKNVNKRLSQIQFKNIPKDEARLIHTQLNKEDIKINIFVASLRKSLEHKPTIAKKGRQKLKIQMQNPQKQIQKLQNPRQKLRKQINKLKNQYRS